MCSILGASFDHWATIEVIGANCIDEDSGLFHKAGQVFGVQSRRLDP